MKTPCSLRIETADVLGWARREFGDKAILVDPEDKLFSLSFTIETERHHYLISVDEGCRSYLGCVLQNRYPDTGETWLRFSDLSDGRLSERTWNSIVEDIKRIEDGFIS